jgi:sulfatase modifying factor 1
MSKKVYFTTGFAVISVILLAWIAFPFQNLDLKNQGKKDVCATESEMIKIKGGLFQMGAGAVYAEETPIIEVKVDSFYISSHEVTNWDFQKFVDATGYVTAAERSPKPEHYPNIKPELLKPGSAVFVKLSEAFTAGTFTNWWHFIEGANWRQPNGPGSDIEGRLHYPVIHIAYEDAVAYSEWKGQRLPTEAEYEFASRGGLDGQRYANGNTLTKNGKHTANTWQGLFPFDDTAEDGFLGLAPVGCYPSNPYGVYDLIGNVWEWTKSKYYPRHFDPNNLPKNLSSNGYDENQPDVSVGVIKGGSYLCADDFCMRYRPAARQAQDTGLGTSHIGFRTAKDL